MQAALALDKEEDYSGAYKVYYEAFKLVDDKDLSKVSTETQNFIISAIKSPHVINFKEILALKHV